jgi:hypothetical protein
VKFIKSWLYGHGARLKRQIRESTMKENEKDHVKNIDEVETQIYLLTYLLHGAESFLRS